MPTPRISLGAFPHTELIKSVARRAVDRRVLHLIKMWLECAVEETDDRGRKRRTTEGCLLTDQLGIRLTRVGSGGRYTFTNPGEIRPDMWLEHCGLVRAATRLEWLSAL
jgi:hypothetical protein